MPKFTCVFVDQDEETIFEDAIALQLESDSAKSAAKEYLNLYGPTGPYVRVLDELGISQFFMAEDFVENPEEREATKKNHAEAKSAAIQAVQKKQAEAKKKQAEAKQAAQSSLSTTDVLLQELIKEQKQMIKEQKQTNEWLKKVRWSLLGINVIMVLWFVFGWVIKPI